MMVRSSHLYCKINFNYCAHEYQFDFMGLVVGGMEMGFMSNDSSIFWFGALFGFACACILFSIFGVK